MSNILFKGIFPAFPTPIDENEKLKVGTIKALMDFEYKGGIQGFYVGGATGEGPVLPVATRMELCEAAIDANQNRGKIIVQIGGPCFSDVKQLVRHADRSGVDAISAMAPNAYYAHTDTELVNYYKSIAELTDKPVLVYVTQLMLGNNLTRVFEELIQVPNIIGLKFTQKDYYLMSLLKMVNGGDINVINGPDEMLISGLAMGADGGIGSTYNLMPEKYETLYQRFTTGDIDGARAMQYEINRIVRVLLSFTGGASGLKCMKAALNVMGFDVGDCAYPCEHFDAETLAKLTKELKAAGLRM